MTELYWHREEIFDRLIVGIRNENMFVQAPIDDNVLVNVPRTAMTEFKKRFLEHLCFKWRETTGEHLEPIPPEEEGQEWALGPVTLEGEIVTNRIGSHVHELLEEINNNMPNPFNVIEGEVVNDAERPAIEGRRDQH